MTQDDQTRENTQNAESAPAGEGGAEDGWRGDKTAIVRRIDALRDEIDRLDEQLVQALNARAGCALQIGQLKKRLQMEIYQPAREEAVLKHVRSVNPGPLDADAIARLFERIIDEARRLERVVQARERETGA
jgi:chorismate mutase